ncbi:hypothetical protein I4U23_009567 [Adineta vaga]|nr:hypothetical protein I4U23_009567 [Adineta vaga]
MSQQKPLMGKKNSFQFRRTKPRKAQSRSPFKFNADQFNRELGSKYETVDVRIGNLRLKLDLTKGIWMPEAVEVNESESSLLDDDDELYRKKNKLEAENSLLSIKLDMLLEMLVQVIAEENLDDESSATK